MALNLLHGGHELLVCDTSATKLRAFCKDTGVQSATFPSELAAETGEYRTFCQSDCAAHGAPCTLRESHSVCSVLREAPISLKVLVACSQVSSSLCCLVRSM